jgi:hypothetical protein
MTSTKFLFTVGALVTALSTASITSAQPPPTNQPVRQAVTKLASNVQSVITGSVVDHNSLPLADAHVRLRNLETKRVEQQMRTNTKGEFKFVVKRDAPYVVELVDRSGLVAAVSEVVTTRAGEVAGTIVKAPARIPGISDLFGDTAGAIIAGVSGLGITAFDSQDQPPVSPEK